VYRISNMYEARLGRNDGNPLYVTAALKRIQYYVGIQAGLPPNQELAGWFADGQPDPIAAAYAKEFWEKEKQMLEVDHIYPTGDLSPFGKYDLNLWIDWGEDGLTGILPYKPIECPKPMLYWASDTHLGYDYRLAMAKKADWVFCAQKRAVEDMKRDGVANPIWLPHAVEPMAYPKFDLLTKRYDVCFVGHVNSQNREDALDRLFKEFPNFYYGQQLFENAARKFAESKIVFNISMLDDINMRTFETMATGSFLLTNWIPTIEEMFEDGKHLVLYRSLDEMVDKAKYYLAHDSEREKIAQAGYEEVMKNHTFVNRVQKMVETVREGQLCKLSV
jgi:glycosyltransferase involved in cell wall biosynthesis